METPIRVVAPITIYAYRNEGETDAEVLQRLQTISEWEDWDLHSESALIEEQT